mgnify:FL=1
MSTSEAYTHDIAFEQLVNLLAFINKGSWITNNVISTSKE